MATHKIGRVRISISIRIRIRDRVMVMVTVRIGDNIRVILLSLGPDLAVATHVVLEPEDMLGRHQDQLCDHGLGEQLKQRVPAGGTNQWWDYAQGQSQGQG